MLRVAEQVFSPRKTIRVIVNAHRKVKRFLKNVFELDSFPRWNVHHVVDNSLSGIDNRRYSDADTGHVFLYKGTNGIDQLSQGVIEGMCFLKSGVLLVTDVAVDLDPCPDV